ncbi:hypothetical protein PMAYCL1PPCAC_12011 [Pristionchus mayeri]|uniref:SSD domain-containing protein n=2 Tax=Pristionchus mayeri TaxID=1317129 RepID=A0AAN4ZMQ4_9BILA|nr:hypothetical protein PMAYCL1PPCAC_12011 [Pristionchus mayeri]
MRIDWVERRFAALFADYSGIVVSKPIPFILFPLIITSLLATGLLHHGQAFMKDELELYTPTDAMARQELNQLDQLFHINDSDPFYATRRYDIKRAGYIIVTHKEDEADVLNIATMKEALALWTNVQSLTISDHLQRSISYPSICVKFPMPPEFGRALNSLISPNVSSENEICVSNPLVEMLKLLLVTDQSFLNRSIDEMTLAQISDAVQLDSVGMVHMLGGVSLDEDRHISGAKAIMLPYALRHSSRMEDSLAEQWELQLVDFLLNYDSPLIRSRPWLAIGGVISAAMAICSGVGLLLHLDFGMTSVAYSMPFIVFSVGVDNVFILLSAWRSTPTHHGLRERMRETFADAAVSITVTSLTDLISFGVGCATPFPSVQMFCAYAVVAVIFTYIYQLTFFAGIMVLECRQELEHKNSFTFMKLQKKSFKLAVHPYGYDPKWAEEKRDRSFEKNHCLSRFFRTTYSDFLLNPVTRLCIISAFLVYLGIAGWGCTKVKLGLEPNDLLPDNSYGKRTLHMAEKYFSDYGSNLHVWMYNLSKVDARAASHIWMVLEKEIELYEHTEFTGGADSWLRTFTTYIKEAGLLVTSDNFVYLLRNVFLSQPQYAKYNRDVVFDFGGSVLEASRVPVQLRHVGAANQSRAMHLFRRLAETSSIPTGVYADFFQFAEQYNAVLPGTLSSIAYAGVAVVFVSLILIPEPTAALWVSFSIVSINIGILGFMTFWGVRLDFISMVTIVMSIGFCVDFAAHLAYNFSKGEGMSGSTRMRNALYAVGTPILQSASSTILGVSFLSSAESYVFRSFLKTIVLVITLGALHGLVILPVLLTIFHCEGDGGDEEREKHPPSEKSTERIYASTSSIPIKYGGGGDSSISTPSIGPPPPLLEYPLWTMMKSEEDYLRDERFLPMRVKLKSAPSREDIRSEKIYSTP